MVSNARGKEIEKREKERGQRRRRHAKLRNRKYVREMPEKKGDRRVEVE